MLSIFNEESSMNKNANALAITLIYGIVRRVIDKVNPGTESTEGNRVIDREVYSAVCGRVKDTIHG